MTLAEKSASKHQQRSGLLPVERAISIEQELGSWQIGQQLGLSVFILKKLTACVFVFNLSI